MSIQLGGNIKLGPDAGSAVDYSSKISRLNINFSRETVTLPATYGAPRASSSAGAEMAEVTIEFFSSTTAADVWHELYDALKTDSAELYFEATYNTGAVSTDNEKWSGVIVVTSLDSNPTVGSLRQQSQTYPVTAAGVTRATA